MSTSVSAHGGGLQVHHLVVVIEGDDEALENSAADIGGIFVTGERAFLLGRVRHNNAGHFHVTQRQHFAPRAT